MGERDTTHLMVLTLGGFAGIALIFEAIGRGIMWWETLSGGLARWQGPEGWHLWVVLGVMILGLVTLFGSLLIARSEESDNPALRRLLYGYVAGLTGLLLFLILLVVNVLAFIYMPEPSDWTSSKLYTLSDQSREVLKGLDRPVKIYFLYASRGFDQRYPSYFDDVSTLLENVRGANSKVQVEHVLRDYNIGRIRELSSKYQGMTEAEGLLVVGEGDADHQFIRKDDLYEFAPMGKRPPFKGEDALVTAINTLVEGKARAVVYFTQGNGELDIGVGGEPGQRPEQRATELVRRLEKANYDVKGLRLGRIAPKETNPRLVTATQVPDDATAVIIAGPQKLFSAEQLEALRKYMNQPNSKGKKGKLLVLSGVVSDPDGRMVNLGLEVLLAEFSVELGSSRILQAEEGFPGTIIAVTNPAIAERNPIAAQLSRRPFVMSDVRVVRTRRGPQPGANVQADDLLRVPASELVWEEENLRDDPVDILNRYKRNQAELDKLNAKLSQQGLTVGAAVSESSGPRNPADPHAFMDTGVTTPRLVVIGSHAFASDASIGERRGVVGELANALFASSLAWLREKPAAIGIPARTRKDYQMDPDTRIWQMLFLWGGVMCICVVGLGLGVWVVRRQ
jgi:hypothetical protein